MEMVILQNYYESNKDFKEYVDKYCAKHKKDVDTALRDNLVYSYYLYLKALEKNL